MTFVDNDQIEIVGGILAEIRFRFTFFGLAAHECLEDRKEDAAVGWDFTVLLDFFGTDPDQSVFGKG